MIQQLSFQYIQICQRFQTDLQTNSIHSIKRTSTNVMISLRQIKINYKRAAFDKLSAENLNTKTAKKHRKAKGVVFGNCNHWHRRVGTATRSRRTRAITPAESDKGEFGLDRG